LISKVTSNRNFIFLPLVVIIAPLVGLIYFDFIYNLGNQFGFEVKQSSIIFSIFNEISIHYIFSILIFSLTYFLIRKIYPLKNKKEFVKIPKLGICITIFAILNLSKIFLNFINVSIYFRLLISNAAFLSLVLLFVSLFINLKINKLAIWKLIILTLFIIVFIFSLTFDKGVILTPVISSLIILLATGNLNFNFSFLKQVLSIISISFLLPILNFIEFFFFKSSARSFVRLTEAMETSVVTNFFFIAYSPTCNLDINLSIIEILFAPIKSLLGGDIDFYSNKLMEICFPFESLDGAGRGFGLINEAYLSKELPIPIYFTLISILFILIFEYFYSRSTLFGLLIFSQAPGIIYKLIRSESINTVFKVSYLIMAAYLVNLLIIILSRYFYQNNNS